MRTGERKIEKRAVASERYSDAFVESHQISEEVYCISATLNLGKCEVVPGSGLQSRLFP